MITARTAAVLAVMSAMSLCTRNACAAQPIDRGDIPFSMDDTALKIVAEAHPANGDTDLIAWRGKLWLATIKHGEGPLSDVEVRESTDGESWRIAGKLSVGKGVFLSRPRFTADGEASLAIDVRTKGQDQTVDEEASPRPGRVRFVMEASGKWRDFQPAPPAASDPPSAAASHDHERRTSSDGRELLLVGRTEGSALLFTREGDRPWSRYDLSRLLQWNKPFDDGYAFAGFTPPNMIESPGNVWIAAANIPAIDEEGGHQTMITWLDPIGGEMRRVHSVPGKTLAGRPGLAWHGGQLLVSRVIEQKELDHRVQLVSLKVKQVDRLTVDVSRDGGVGSYEAFPDITRLKDGRLFCTFYAGYGHVTYPSKAWPRGGSIVACTSDDEGKTWSAPFTVVDGPKDDRDPSITQLPDGRLLCVYFTYPNPVVQLVESADAGRTWSRPRAIAPQGLAVSSPVRVLDNGRLVLGLYTVKERTGAAIFSDDQGKTWSEPIIIDSGGAKLDAETDIIERRDRSLYALQRGPVGTQAHYSVSNDHGETWSVSKPVGFEAHAPYLYRTSQGIVLLGYRPIIDRTGAGAGIRYSTDDCKTWSELALADLGGGYVSFVELEDGSILAVYYTDQGIGPARSDESHPGPYLHRHSNIRAKRFRVDADGITWMNVRE